MLPSTANLTINCGDITLPVFPIDNRHLKGVISVTCELVKNSLKYKG